MSATITMFRGDTQPLNLYVTSGGAPKSLSGVSLTFSTKYNRTDTTYVFQKTIGNGITVVSESGGTATILINSSDTSFLPGTQTRLQYDVQYAKGSDIYTISSGVLVVNPDVTT